MPEKTLITQAQAQRIATSAANKVRKSAVIGFVILLTGGIVGFELNQSDNQNSREAVVDSGKAVATVSCNRDFKQTTELRTIIKSGRDQVSLLVSEGTLTPAQGQRQVDLSNDALRRLPLPDCRQAGDDLTSDPDEDIKIPAALHPGK